jgi:hypothetical protein
MQNICWHPLQVAIPLPVLHLAQGLRVSIVVINDFEKTIYEVYEIQLNCVILKKKNNTDKYDKKRIYFSFEMLEKVITKDIFI